MSIFKKVFVSLFVLYLFCGLAASVFQCNFLASPNMQPTLQQFDSVTTEKLSHLLHLGYDRGEIISFHPPAVELEGSHHDYGPIVFVQRVIGIAGDQVGIQADGTVSLNGKKLDETRYATAAPTFPLKTLGDIGGLNAFGKAIRPYGSKEGDPVVVPPGFLFVLADNRIAKVDSRVFGFLDQNQVVGRVVLDYYPHFHFVHVVKIQ